MCTWAPPKIRAGNKHWSIVSDVFRVPYALSNGYLRSGLTFRKSNLQTTSVQVMFVPLCDEVIDVVLCLAPKVKLRRMFHDVLQQGFDVLELFSIIPILVMQ